MSRVMSHSNNIALVWHIVVLSLTRAHLLDYQTSATGPSSSTITLPNMMGK